MSRERSGAEPATHRRAAAERRAATERRATDRRAAAERRAAGPGEDERRLPVWLVALGFAFFAVAGMLAGLIEVTLIPLRYGTALVPVAPVLTVLTGVLLPAIGRALTDSAPAAAPAAIGQLLTIWVLATGRPEGDVLTPAGSTAWVSYTVLILGTLVPLAVLGFASRPGPWRWPLGGAHRWPAARRSRGPVSPDGSRRARHGSDTDGVR